MKDKILALLGLGLPNNVVASAVGVSDSYVSQLMGVEDFARQVQELRLKNLTEIAARDKKWDSLEDRFLQKLEDLLPMGGFSRPMEILKALQVLNAAKRRASPQELPAAASYTVVPLILPIVMAPKLSVNSQGQVIEVEGRVLATMPAAVVNKKLEALRGGGKDSDQKLLEADAAKARNRIATLQRLNALAVYDVI